jgi:SAM-dependent methyltransferase
LEKYKYQDYVIKDGTFIGEFEEMYKVFDDPWHQSSIDFSITRNSTILNINKYGVKSCVEFGCGLGYFTNNIKLNTSCSVIGVDISESAIKKAKLSFPHIPFEVNNVNNIKIYSSSDAIIFAEITWYILPQLNQVFEDMLKYFPNKLFFHNLVFYQEETQKYGRDYFINIEEFINYCPFKLIEKVVITPSSSERSIETHSVFEITKK